MGKILRSVAVIVVLIFFCLQAYSQGSTSKGTEFWTGFMAHANPPDAPSGNSTMFLYITSDVTTSGNVAVADGSFSKDFDVTANQITILPIPASAFIGGQGTYNKGIHITALKPIAVYAHIFAQNASGATLLLPVSTLGKDYDCISYTQSVQEGSGLVAYSDFMVIATEDNSTVMITPSVNLLDGKPAGQAFAVHLNKGEVYQGLAATDVTGTRIQSVGSGTNSCTKIAVFSGSSRTMISCNADNVSSDNLFQQVYPTAAWGKNYLTVPLKNRNFDIFRIIVSNPATNVQLNGAAIDKTTLVNGLYYQFTSTQPNLITADQPIQVVQYAVSQKETLNCGIDLNDIGDPEMIFLTPLEQTLNHVTLYSTSNFLILSSYINVAIKTSAVSSFMLDGSHYTNFSPVATDPGYSYAQIPVNSGTHNISADDGFNAIAYGFGIFESYGYAAGANLQDLNSFISMQNTQTSVSEIAGCTNATYNVQLTLPYKASKIVWDAQNGVAPLTKSNPDARQIQKGTQTLYVYDYPKNPVSYALGSYSILATATDPNGDDCGSDLKYEFDFNVTDPPQVSFAPTNLCAGETTVFTPKALTGNDNIKSWLWDFGDGQTSTDQNTSHTYAASGDYNVSLTVTDKEDCTGVSTLTGLHISAKPIASFTPSAPVCVGQNVTFTDNSSAAEGTIIKWVWDFGDGQTSTYTDKQASVDHTYNATGNYTVKLTVTGSTGCVGADFSQTITVNPIPQVDFAMLDVCLSDTYAQFTDKSTIDDNTASEFTYLWDFGDKNASALNPNTSTEKDPKHKYMAADNYTVTLTVTSKYGCPVTKKQAFTVNGTDPVAHFHVENEGQLCSDDDVVFVDESFVNGNIIRLEWYFDYNNHPTDFEPYTSDNMPADKKYRHKYPVVDNDPTPRNYQVRLIAYSGATCVSQEYSKTITVNTSPRVALNLVGDICQGANPVQLQADNKGFSGTGVFSGPGVSAQGLFNPAKADVGAVTINYTFTADNGCSYSTSEQINVIADPVVTADARITVLEGSAVTLNARASGNSLTYKWTPSTGLDHDDVLTPAASPIDDTQYTLTVTSADKCTAQAQVFVKVLKNIIIPNTFTPNGDGINDTWNIKYLDNYPNCTIDIYNRYGEKVYSSIGYAIPWDGKFKGAYLPAGTYYYIINPKHGRKTVSGPVTIIR